MSEYGVDGCFSVMNEITLCFPSLPVFQTKPSSEDANDDDDDVDEVEVLAGLREMHAGRIKPAACSSKSAKLAGTG